MAGSGNLAGRGFFCSSRILQPRRSPWRHGALGKKVPFAPRVFTRGNQKEKGDLPLRIDLGVFEFSHKSSPSKARDSGRLVPCAAQCPFQALYRPFTGPLQALYRRFTGALQALYKPFTCLAQARYRPFASTFTGVLQALYRPFTSPLYALCTPVRGPLHALLQAFYSRFTGPLQALQESQQ